VTEVERLDWIEDRIAEEPGQCVDVCNTDFVQDYIDATTAPHRVRLWGAPRCIRLSAELLKMHKEGRLRRSRTGIQGMGGMGFPTWVWSYRLSPAYAAYPLKP
jgi:hypothetical protein